jgi:hypothetical protein
MRGAFDDESLTGMTVVGWFWFAYLILYVAAIVFVAMTLP